MNPIGCLILGLGVLFGSPAHSRVTDPARFSEMGFPAALSRAGLESLLQSFVDQSYLKCFRHLGDERDFDHGHFLFDPAGKPVAILYHTQELAMYNTRRSGFGYINPQERNWIQWLEDGRVENAARYKRRDYPRTPTWDWFRETELPGLEAHHTILDKMLDPALLPIDAARTKQWVFTRVPCGGDAPSDDSKGLRILLPTRETACLALSSY
jgi:hypothetical protein